ncbi:hypothetical protein PUF88_04755 [Lactobacillaceae bacterium L1_55_11]|nr:hypothetical protein [Lactobacillaceae bacterium L1_55_11]
MQEIFDDIFRTAIGILSISGAVVTFYRVTISRPNRLNLGMLAIFVGLFVTLCFPSPYPGVFIASLGAISFFFKPNDLNKKFRSSAGPDEEIDAKHDEGDSQVGQAEQDEKDQES